MPEFPISKDHPWLAPLAGFSDLPFRLLCRRFGCKVAVTEMVSAKGLFYNPQENLKYIKTVDEDSPLVVQLFGEDPNIIEKAIIFLKNKGYKYFDLNTGCPVKKVTKTGAGAALLRDLGKLKNILETMAKVAGAQNVGIKTRLGWDKQNITYKRVAEIAHELGIGWISLHPRFAKQGFSGKADWTAIKEIKQRVKVPIIASGDLLLAEDGIRCIKETGADSIMFARGALKNPAIFLEYLELLKGNKISDVNKIKIEMIKLHIELIKEYSDIKNPVLKIRGILAKYIRGFRESKKFREKAVKVNSFEEVSEIIKLLEEAVCR